MVTYTTKVLIPFKRVLKKEQDILPFTGISTLLLKPCHKNQENKELLLKLNTWLYHQGTYTPLWGVT